VAPLDQAAPSDVSFYSNPTYRRQLASSRARAIIVGASDADLPELKGRALLIAAVPYAAFARVATAFHTPPVRPAGIDAAARVEAGAEVDPSARVEAFAFVGAGAHVGASAVIMSGAYVGPGAHIGAGTVLAPRAIVMDRCIVGARCLLHSGAVIGADGFGFAFDPEGDGEGPIHRKIPQAGIARLDDDVEIGANSCVDRATFGETVIGRGTKLDNMVQIGHNVVVGPLCVIAAQTGIAGSTTVGSGVVIGGQVGLSGHIRIGDMARVGPRSGVAHDIPDGATMIGYPALEHRLWMRASVAFARLPELLREVRDLRRRLGPSKAGGAGSRES
jgi:UDP-3-O-[3-hydroxymyristoyl] glucosamine N-acyltransferase